MRPARRVTAIAAAATTAGAAVSDARAIRTHAERSDGGWLINGHKTFISNAGTDMSFGVTVLARTGEDADGKAQSDHDHPDDIWDARQQEESDRASGNLARRHSASS